jgi:hypothetical protein
MELQSTERQKASMQESTEEARAQLQSCTAGAAARRRGAVKSAVGGQEEGGPGLCRRRRCEMLAWKQSLERRSLLRGERSTSTNDCVSNDMRRGRVEADPTDAERLDTIASA